MHLEIDFKIGIQLIGICSASLPRPWYPIFWSVDNKRKQQVALLAATRAEGNLQDAILWQTKSVNPLRQREAVLMLTCNQWFPHPHTSQEPGQGWRRVVSLSRLGRAEAAGHQCSKPSQNCNFLKLCQVPPTSTSPSSSSSSPPHTDRGHAFTTQRALSDSR